MPRPQTALEVVWKNVWVRAITFVVLGIFLLWVLLRYSDKYAFVLQVGIIGFLIAFILNPLVDALVRLRIRRGFAVLLVYLGLLLSIALGSVLLSQVVVQTGKFISLIPEAIENIDTRFDAVADWSAGVIENLPPWLRDRFISPDEGPEGRTTRELALDRIETFIEDVARSFSATVGRIVTGSSTFVFTGVANILSTTLQILLILLASAYFLYDFPKITSNFKRFVPTRWKPLYEDISKKADRAVGGYLRGQLLISLLLGFLIYVGLVIIGVPLAESIAVLATVFNLVPYLGPIIGAIPAVLLGFTISPLTALLAIVVFVAANQIEGNLLSPMVLSKSTNLHPVTVLLSILAGLGLFGIVGALIAVPAVALTKVILEDYLLQRPAYGPWEDDTPVAVTTQTVAAPGAVHESPKERPEEPEAGKPVKTGD